MYVSGCTCVHVLLLFQILPEMDKLCGVGSVSCVCVHTCSGLGRLMCACRKVSVHLCVGVG